MKIDLNRSDGSTTPFELTIPAAELDLESEYARVNGDVTATGRVSNEDTITVIEADVTAPVLIDCSRCLEEISSAESVSFRTAFVSNDEFTEDQEIELDLQDLELSFADDDEVDLVEVIREQIVLALPSRPLCREDCKGLCNICGGNLNKTECDCTTEETDPRWAALKDLK